MGGDQKIRGSVQDDRQVIRRREMMLSLNNIEVAYDRVFLAVKSISIDVPEGGLVALLGANGAGKSTTLKAISGLLRPERGEVTKGEIKFAGKRSAGARSARPRAAGARPRARGPPRICASDAAGKSPGGDVDAPRSRAYQRPLERTFAWFPRLAERADAQAGYLSGGEQQMLAIGRALMTEPKLLLLGRAESGACAPAGRRDRRHHQAHQSARAKSRCLLVEQNAAMALDIVQHAYLMESGRIVMSGPAEVVKSNPDVEAAYLGGGHTGRLSGGQALPKTQAMARVTPAPIAIC